MLIGAGPAVSGGSWPVMAQQGLMRVMLMPTPMTPVMQEEMVLRDQSELGQEGGFEHRLRRYPQIPSLLLSLG